MTSISIPLSEFRRATALYRFTDHDEREELGMLRLRCDGNRRTWAGSDGSEGMVVLGGSDRNVYDLGLSWALISAAEALAGGDDTADLRVEAEVEDGVPLIHLIGTRGRSTFWDRQLDYPTITQPLIEEDSVAGVATVGAGTLRDALESMRYKRVHLADKDAADAITMTFVDGELVLQKREPDVGRLDVNVSAPGAWSDVSVGVSAQALHRLLDAVHPSDEVTIKLSKWNSDVLSFESEEWFAFLHPYRTPNAVAKDQVTTLLRDMFGPVALHTDADGDHPLRLHGNPIYGRFHLDDEQTLWFRVFAVVVRDISGGPEVFTELNELNANTTFVRLFHVGEQILAEVDLLAATLDRAELDAAITRITAIAEEVMPTLSAVLGGSVPADASEKRWSDYRSTILEAELIPGRLFNLNGPDALDEFPFPDRCFAITAWNPMGTSRSPEKNRELNQAVAKDVVDLGGMFVRGFGASPDGEYSEETLFVWGIDRENVRILGRRAQQDAIFEVDADSVRLISCFDDRQDEWPRRS